MRILLLHCDYIRFKALKKAFKDAEELPDKEEKEMKECLVVLTAVEKGDGEEQISQLLESVNKTAKEVGAKNVVLYPYAHLSSNLASPKTALETLLEAEKKLSKSFKVIRAPFGHYKQFELKVKGHPLSELSREFKGVSVEPKKGSSKGEEDVDPEEIQKLVKRLSKVSMQALPGKNNQKSHVELGRDLDLFIVNEVVGQGLPLFTPRGATIKRIIERFIIDEELKRGYEHTSTPFMAKSDLYKVSGHWQHYQDSMFCISCGNETLALRPMTCPFHFILYKRKPRSYRDLPKKYAEVASLFRNEQSGELRGLTRVRQFTLADAHIVCMPEQLEQQFTEVLDLLKYCMAKLGLKDIWYRFSKWDSKDKKKYIDNPEAWESSQKLMKKILDKLKVDYVEAEGEAAFYGPKLDLQCKDVYGKEDTLLTIQIDFALPERYDMTYKDKDGNEKRPLVIHRSSTGATERIMASVIEKTQGNLPLWLSPTQIKIINFTDRNTESCKKFASRLKADIPSLRIEEDYRQDTVQSKVRDAEMLKTNYVVVIGDKEEESNTLAVRPRGKKPSYGVKYDDFVADIKKELED